MIGRGSSSDISRLIWHPPHGFFGSEQSVALAAGMKPKTAVTIPVTRARRSAFKVCPSIHRPRSRANYIDRAKRAPFLRPETRRRFAAGFIRDSSSGLWSFRTLPPADLWAPGRPAANRSTTVMLTCRPGRVMGRSSPLRRSCWPMDVVGVPRRADSAVWWWPQRDSNPCYRLERAAS